MILKFVFILYLLNTKTNKGTLVFISFLNLVYLKQTLWIRSIVWLLKSQVQMNDL